ncbi:MAG TPA: LuxR C-terminal-related transcriptional regulator, partial [Ktedonobacteraceae bacterium]
RSDGSLLPESGMALIAYADVLREWNQLDAALEMGLQGISLLQQRRTLTPFRLGCTILVHIYLSRGELDAARTALQQFDALGEKANIHLVLHTRSVYVTVDQVRLWLAEGNLARAIQWAEQLERGARPGMAFAHEREEVALVRILLARRQPTRALEHLESLLTHATTAGRRRHVMEMWLLQAQAYHLLHEEQQALAALALAIRQGEPEGYIRCFVDEGPVMVDLLARLRVQEQKKGPTMYLDTLLLAFPPRNKSGQILPARSDTVALPTKRVPSQPLLDPLSERELDVLYELVQGVSNQDIAGRLTISVETVKRHLTNIFSKLGVKSRVQAVSRARVLGLIHDDV